MRKILFITIIICIALLASFVILRAVGSYFLLDNFVTNDAAPLADPHTTEPGGQSVDAVETDGTMAIANGKLTFTAQSTPVNGDLGLRYATNMTDYMGRAIFYKLKFNTLANGIAGYNNASEMFGVTPLANVVFRNFTRRGFGINASYFTAWTISDSTDDFNFLTVPNTTDSFYVALVLGGSNTVLGSTAATWYAGQNAAPDTNGAFYFVKRNATGNWILQGKGYGDEESGNAFPGITNYNGAFSIDRWAASNDTVRDGYLSPIHLQKMDGTNGNQLFDDTPEVGAAYDSINGNFTFTADNRVNPAGTVSGDLQWFTTTTVSDDEVFMESTPTVRFGDNGSLSLVMRYKASPLSFIIAGVSEPGNALQIYTYESAAYTLRANSGAGAFSYPVTDTPTYLASSVMDSAGTTIMRTWYEAAASQGVFQLRYKHASNFNSGANKHGIRIAGAGGTNIKIDELRIYPLGTDGEFAGLDAYFIDSSARGRIIKVNY